MIPRIKNRINQSNKISRRQYYLLYTCVFAIAILLVYGIFFLNGKSFVRESDGWNQHLKALIYYAKYLRNIVRTLLFEHRLEIPMFSFSIGYGSDILGTLHYYVIGDPLTLFSVFVPTRYMAYFYDALIIVRLYLMGITFSAYCFYRSDRMAACDPSGSYGNMAALAGTLVYVFCGFSFYTGINHPYFVNPMIYFPLVLLGVEKILNREKPFLFVASVFLSAISNFYFFYMIVILTVLYVVWRLITVYSKSEIKKAFCMTGKITGFAILGTCMSAVILFPVILTFFNSARTGTNYVYDFLYSISDYEESIGGFLSVATGGHDFTVMGYSAIALIALVLLFFQKGHRDLKIAFAVLSVMTLLPVVGSVMNGFSYVANRWIWGYSFFVAYIVVVKWKSLFTLTEREKRILLVCLCVYLFLCMVLVKSRAVSVLFAIAMAFLFFTIICLGKDLCGIRWLQILLILCILANVTGNALFKFSQRNSGYVKVFLAQDEILNQLKHTEASAVKAVSKETEGFFRYSGNSVTVNDTLYSGLHSTQYYWSLENGNIGTFRSDQGLSDTTTAHNYKTLDSRTILSTLANVKYYVQNQQVPYGFTEIGEYGNYKDISDYLNVNLGGGEYTEDKLTEEEKTTISDMITYYTIWENDYFLPFGYTYDTYISADDYEQMTPLQKQEALLQGCVIDAEGAQGEETSLSFTGQSIDYEMSVEDGITLEDNCITVSQENAAITLTFDGMANAETYCYITGLSYEGISPMEQYTNLQWDLMSVYDQNELRNSEKYYEEPTSLSITLTAKNTEGSNTSKTWNYRTPKYTWYNNRSDFMITFAYDENAKTSITLKFPTQGKYSFDSIEVLCQPMDNYPMQVAALAEDVMENVDFHENQAYATNTVTGTITLDTPKYLLLTIPFSEGWTAYVDGTEQEILKANTCYMALYLDEGEHTIELTYRTPGIVTGVACSTGSAALLILLAFLWKAKKKGL